MADERLMDPWLLRFRWLMPLALFPLAIIASDAGGRHLTDPSFRELWEVLCLTIASAGLAIRMLAVGFVDARGRRRDDATLPTGLHSIVRYPLYLGTFVSLFGISLLPASLWFAAATSAAFFFWYGSLVFRAERAALRRGSAAVGDGAPRVPLVLPNFSLWRKPVSKFSLGQALRHERNDFFFVVASFVGLELSCDLLGEDLPFVAWLREDLHWALLLGVATLVFLTLWKQEAAVAAGPVERAGPVTLGVRVDGRARYVDTLENLISFGRLTRILESTLAASRLTPGDSLLDVGCGSGVLAIRAEEIYGAKASGIDATPAMIERARANSAAARSSARFDVGVGEALPFPDASFDAVTSSYFLHHLPSDVKRTALREMWRVLRPGGRLVIADYGRPTSVGGWIAAIPMRFDFHEYVRGQLAGELDAIIDDLGNAEQLESFLGYINVIRLVKPEG